MGSVGDCFDNAVIESFWSRMQVEQLDRKRWTTRVGLATAIFEYLEIFHNRRRRHSARGMLTRSSTKRDTTTAQHEITSATPPNPGHPTASAISRTVQSRSGTNTTAVKFTPDKDSSMLNAVVTRTAL
jgi:hypothetical protein